jgi:hypothetical protein
MRTSAAMWDEGDDEGHYELYERDYRLKKLKCPVLPLQKAQDITIDDAEAFIAHHQGG